MITAETRQMSFNDIQDKTKIRYIQILNRLDRPKTAKELAVELFELGLTNTSERNTTRAKTNRNGKNGICKSNRQKEM